MSEDAYPTVQYSMFVTGDQIVLRAPDGEKLADAAESMAMHADRLTESVTGIKQAIIAKGVFTGDVGSTQSQGQPRTQASGYQESGPPVDGIPHCKHGEMQDLGDKGYKSRYYCTLNVPRDRWREKCKPVG